MQTEPNESDPAQAPAPTTLQGRSRRLPLAARVLVGVILGAILGVVFGTRPYLGGLRNEDLGALGLLVIKMLRTLAIPLVLFAILDALTQTRISARRGGRLIFICLVNASVAMTIALTLMNTIRPGVRWRGHLGEMQAALQPTALKTGKVDDPDAPAATLALIPNIEYYVPRSMVQPFLYNNIISVVLIGLLLGSAIRHVRERELAEGNDTGGVGVVVQFVNGGYQVLVQSLEWIVQIVPFAVFGVVAKVVGAAGLQVFQYLWVFLVIALLGLGLQALVYYPLVAWLWGRKPPRVYLGMGADAILTGLSTNSSLATVPLTLRCLSRMGVSPASARLAACVGTNLNNDGITLYEAVAALFLAQAVGMNLGIGQQMVVVVSAIMAGAGVAGVPEAGLIVLPLVLGAVGLPDTVIASALPLLLPVDWIIARVRSGVNVMADMLVAVLLDADQKPGAVLEEV